MYKWYLSPIQKHSQGCVQVPISVGQFGAGIHSSHFSPVQPTLHRQKGAITEPLAASCEHNIFCHLLSYEKI